MAEAYPLSWPPGRARTQAWNRQRSQFKTTFTKARDGLLKELDRLGCAGVVLSTNLRVRQDNLPMANQRTPEDPGVAVYFMHKKKQMCFACDKYKTVGDNLRAVALTIEALRGIKRWGTGDMMERAFSGFTALPDLSRPADWRDVLGVPGCRVLSEAREAWKKKRAETHPDTFEGTVDKFNEVNQAWEQAQQELGS